MKTILTSVQPLKPLHAVFLLLLILSGFALRLHYLTTTHPFFDEHITVLAARETLRHGWPQLPSGLFYEHGLLATYLITPFTALFINSPHDGWQAAQWRLMLARWPSLLLSTLTIPLLYAVGRRCLRRTEPALFAAALFALSPEGMVWGGRARMYALATLLVLLTVYFAYRGLNQQLFWWMSLLFLALALLTQLGVLLLIPPLLVAIAVLITMRRSTVHGTPLMAQLLTLSGIIGLALLIKRLGQPLGKAALSHSSSSPLLLELFETVAYQTSFYVDKQATITFLARQFGVSHLYWLTIATLIGSIVSLIVWLGLRDPQSAKTDSAIKSSLQFTLFLSLIFGLILLEAVTLLEPFRRNSRYFVMYLPLFYLIAAQALYFPLNNLSSTVYIQFFERFWTQNVAIKGRQLKQSHASPPTNYAKFPRYLLPPTSYLLPSTLYLLPPTLYLLLLLTITLPDLTIALDTPEPAYEEAFAFVRHHWQAGDTLLTMHSAAAALYLHQVDGFAVEREAPQFLLPNQTDRWTGAPWIGSPSKFHEALAQAPRSWFVSDTIRQPEYYGGGWQAVLISQMDLVWQNDNALVYRTKAERPPLSTRPQVEATHMLDNRLKLLGHSWQPPDLTLFWQPLSPLEHDYTTFIHLRDRNNGTVYQQDGQPLNGTYPTSRWHVEEIIIDPIRLTIPPDLPSGDYRLLVGLYRLDTSERLPVNNDQSGENALMVQTLTLPDDDE